MVPAGAWGRRALGLLALAPLAARAQEAWPARQVTIVVGVAPGGTADLAARLLAAELPRALGSARPFVVENRPGAATQIGTDLVAKSAPDGQMLLVAGAPFAINPGLFPRLPYDPVADFAPVTLLVRGGLFLLVPAGSPDRDVAGLLARARAQGGLNVASAGNASMSHMALELLSARAGVPLTHVPYRGSGPAVPDLISGTVDAMFDNPSTALPLVREGRLRALAFTGGTRSEAAPEVPALAELLPGFAAENWFGLFARAGTPEAVLARLHAAVVAVLGRADVAERFARDGVVVAPMGQAAFAAFLRGEMAGWAEVIRARGITPG